MRRLCGMVLVVGLAAWALPQGLAFANSSETSGTAGPALSAYSFGSQSGAPASVLLLGTDSPGNTLIGDGPDSSTISVSDTGGVGVGDGCEQMDFQTATCSIFPPRAITALLRGGDDHLKLEASNVFARSVDGGAGPDQLRGGRGRDTLIGGKGSDLVRGARGGDRLFGLEGRDTLRGGAGKDRLRADDGMRDKLINCGRGRHDWAKIDHKDPKPKRCESVTVASGDGS